VENNYLKYNISASILKKETGQALIEAVILISVIFVGTFFLIAVFYNQIISMAADELLETYFFCQIQKKQNCRSDLNNNLQYLRLYKIQIFENNYPPNYQISLSATTHYNYEIYKKRALQFEIKF